MSKIAKVLIGIGAIVLLAVLVVLGFAFNWIGSAANVAQQQLDPALLLQRYEWFKDAAAQLDKKQADMIVYANRLKNLEAAYASVQRKDWPKEDREQYNLWLTEIAGIKASFNLLAAEYNAQMSKVNYRFTNTGELPRGATVPLPREFKPYIME